MEDDGLGGGQGVKKKMNRRGEGELGAVCGNLLQCVCGAVCAAVYCGVLRCAAVFMCVCIYICT